MENIKILLSFLMTIFVAMKIKTIWFEMHKYFDIERKPKVKYGTRYGRTTEYHYLSVGRWSCPA